MGNVASFQADLVEKANTYANTSPSGLSLLQISKLSGRFFIIIGLFDDDISDYPMETALMNFLDESCTDFSVDVFLQDSVVNQQLYDVRTRTVASFRSQYEQEQKDPVFPLDVIRGRLTAQCPKARITAVDPRDPGIVYYFKKGPQILRDSGCTEGDVQYIGDHFGFALEANEDYVNLLVRKLTEKALPELSGACTVWRMHTQLLLKNTHKKLEILETQNTIELILGSLKMLISMMAFPAMLQEQNRKISIFVGTNDIAKSMGIAFDMSGATQIQKRTDFFAHFFPQ